MLLKSRSELFKKYKPAKRLALVLVLSLAIFLSGLTLMGSTGMHSLWQYTNRGSSITPTVQLVNPSPTSTPAPVIPSDINETTGVILAGAILVLIILGGTINATRRKF
jgi:hypothetical protein